MSLVFAYVTVGSVEEGKRIGRALVEERLAACANILPTMISVFRWEGRLEDAEEAVLIVKTRAELFDRLAERVRDLHSYDVPCVLEVPLGRGSADFVGWIMAETAAEARRD